MITGLNTDVEYQGKIYHVQTEDAGRDHPTIMTILFHSGAILATRRTGYADLVNTGNLTAALKQLMSRQHKEMIRDLQAGRLFQPAGTPAPQPPTGPPTGAGDSSLSADRTSKDPSASASDRKKSLDDLILDYLSAREERKKP